jgi:general secretion pathway protein E
VVDFGNTTADDVFARLVSGLLNLDAERLAPGTARAGSGWTSVQDLWSTGAASGASIAQSLSDVCGLPLIEPHRLHRQKTPIPGLSTRFLRANWCWPVADEEGVALAIADPTRTDVVEAVRKAIGADAPVLIASFDELSVRFEQFEGNALPAAAVEQPPRPKPGDDLQYLQDIASGEPIVHQVERMLEAALALSATDIHLEPGADALAVRFRVDGRLRAFDSFSPAMARGLVSRIKILAGLDISETRLPQDGGARLKVSGSQIDLRIATIPTVHGEAAVMRLLVKEARILDFAQLGMEPGDVKLLRAQLDEPYGLIIVAGPTGSGKTTTLAAALSHLNQVDRKIMTIEDPIEYQIAGIHQSQTKPQIGFTFANALRALLRHDPDVLMVGEMRDRETASVGVQAALTGHLVLTTLHTNSAVDAVIRLNDLGVEDFLLLSSVRGVVGQRLVRKLCERCREPLTENPKEIAALAGIGEDAVPPGARLHGARGCEWCGQTGYRGRTGIYEVWTFDPQTREQLRSGLDGEALMRAARQAGMRTMFEDGLAKACRGVTTLDEVLKVARPTTDGAARGTAHSPPQA